MTKFVYYFASFARNVSMGVAFTGSDASTAGAGLGTARNAALRDRREGFKTFAAYRRFSSSNTSPCKRGAFAGRSDRREANENALPGARSTVSVSLATVGFPPAALYASYLALSWAT